jgi:hypothetical protein
MAALPALARPARALSFEALFAPKAAPWPRWRAHDAAATERVDHAPWARLIAAHRRIGDDGIVRFAYRQVSAADRADLDAYLEALQAIAVSRLARPEQFAYWVNLYNALTVRVVLDHYPVDSIRDIDLGGGVFGRGPWRQALVTIEGEPIRLNDIEHRILRPIWQDPRLHYVVNCAALGCPDLPPEPLTADNGGRLLDAGAEAYVNHPRGVGLTDTGMIVSSIYVWFADDFGGDDARLVEHLRHFARPPLAARLAAGPRIVGHAYDWRLNDAST